MKKTRPFLSTARIAAAVATLVLGTASVAAHAAPKFSLCGSVLTQNDDGNWVMWNRGLAGLDEALWAQGLSNDAMLTPRRLRSIETLFASPGQSTPTPQRIFCGVGGTTGHAKLSDGRLMAWGTNSYGVLGVGDQSPHVTPTQVQGAPTDITEVVYGAIHALALTQTGALWGWGTNGVGQVGTGQAVEAQTTPVQVLTGVSSVAAGAHHSLAVMNDGTVRSWGYNSQGQLGLGDTTDRLSPTPVPGLTNVVGVAAGEYYSLAVKADGTVWAWGANSDGQHGNGGNTASNVPVQAPGLANMVKLKTNRYTSVFGVDSSGTVWSWGRNARDNLAANQSACTANCLPAQVPGLPSNIVAIDSTTYSGFAITLDGRIFGWGYNGSGVLGRGRLNLAEEPTSYATPVLVRQGVMPSDFDRDYVSDILFRDQQSGDIWSWKMSGAAVASSGAIGNVSTNWQIVGSGDADGDGKDDLYWRNSVDGGNAVWTMDGRSLKGAMTLPSVGDNGWTVDAVADLDGDGRADMLWRHAASGMWAVWLIGDAGVTASQVYGGVPSEWQIRGVGDFNGDGKADIIWRDSVSGAVAIYRMNGTAVAGTSFLAGGLGEWDVASVSDTDRDGRAEILFRSLDGASLAEVHLTNDATAFDGAQTRFLSTPGPAWQLVTLGDYDGDTHLDILWKNVSSGELVVWRLENLVLPGATADQQFTNVRFLGTPTTGWQVVPR